MMDSTAATPARTRTRVLVVEEDDAGVARLAFGALEGDCDVCAVSDPRDALVQLACGAQYDVILLGLHLPVIDGAAVFERLLEYAPALARRVVIMTGGEVRHEDVAFLSERGALQALRHERASGGGGSGAAKGSNAQASSPRPGPGRRWR